VKICEIVIVNEVGLHARPAKTFVQTAQKFSSKVTVTYRDKTVNAKSLLSLLTLGVSKGAQIRIEVEGEDEDKAMQELEALIHSNFGE
jgi:phosphocarrier protein HPr